MPKIKTNRGAAKRFKLTATGKVKRRKAGLRHILTSKDRRQKRGLAKAGYVAAVDADAVKKMMPYG